LSEQAGEGADGTLRDGERQLRLLLAELDDRSIYMLDASGHVATWNLAAARLIGFASERIVGSEFAVLFSETDRQAGIPDQMLAEAARSGRYVRQIERIRPDGTRFTSSVSVQRVDEPAGTPGGFAVIEHDLTLRQQLAARETAARLFEDYPDAVLTVDQTGQIVHANSRAPEMFGYDRETLLGEQIELLVPARFRTAHVQQRVSSGENPRHRPFGSGLELYALQADGNEFPADIQLGPVRAYQQGKTITIAIVRDVTAMKALAGELEASRHRQAVLEERQVLTDQQRRWAEAFERAAAGIFIADSVAGTIEIANPAFAAALGMTVEQVQGMAMLDAFPPADHARVADVNGQADTTGHMMAEIRLRRQDGSDFPAQIDVTSVRDADGTIPYRIISIIDISQTKRAESALHQSLRLHAVSELSGKMARDFNDLLAVIIGNLNSMLGVGTLSTELDVLAGDAIGAAMRGATLTNQLLAFAQQQPLQRLLVSVNKVILETADWFGRMPGQHIEVVLDLAGDLWPVLTDPVQISTSIANLALNAREAMPYGGRLAISTTNRRLGANYVATFGSVPAGDYVLIEFADTGVGIAPEAIVQIFEPFYTTKDRATRPGLGLSVVYGFAHQSGGYITVESQPGNGAVFRLYLPAAGEHRASAPATSPPVANAPSPGETILVVESEAPMQRVMVRQLTQMGYRVVEAMDRAGALAILERETVHLVVAGMRHPSDTDKNSLAQQLLDQRPSIQVLLVSGAPAGHPMGEIIGDREAVRVLQRPYRRAELARVVRDMLGRRPGREGPGSSGNPL
jgi:two-component system, cell cycle sensor histidine kinase and response regulator CckA